MNMELSDRAIRNTYTVANYGKDLLEIIFHREMPLSKDYMRRSKLIAEDAKKAIDNAPGDFVNCLVDITALRRVHLVPRVAEIYGQLVKDPKIRKVAVLGNSIMVKATINFIFFGSFKLRYFSDKQAAYDWLNI